MELSIIWWNTSLSPVGKSRATENQKTYFKAMISLFIEQLNVDLISLCEIQTDDISLIRDVCYKNNYEIHNGNRKAGKSKFDTCVIFNKSKLDLLKNEDLIAIKNKSTFKVAQRFDFAIPEHDIPLHIFISHWPSRLHMKQNDPDRSYLGMKLRSFVDKLIEIYNEEASFILLGDYNDEPFDSSLSEHLMATRDRDLAQKRTSLLYNPFWRKLGHNYAYSHNQVETKCNAGTYYYKSDTITRWRTFDQMIFSSSFLGRSKWHLNEELTQIINISEYRDLVLNPKEIFDHFPVLGVIERIQ